MPLSFAGVRALDQRLTDFVCGKAPDESQYIADQVLMTMPVSSQNYKGEVWVETEAPAMGQTHIEMKREGMQPFAEAHDADPSSVAYECSERSILRNVAADLIARSEFPLDLIDRAAGFIRRALIIEYEIAVRDAVFVAGVWDAANTSTLAALGASGNKFGTAGAEEISDLIYAKNLARDAALGNSPDLLVIGEQAVDELSRNSTQLRSLLGDNTQRAFIPYADVIALLGDSLGCEVLIGSGWYNSANPGQTASNTRIWGDNAAFLYRGSNGIGVNGGVVTNACTALAFKEDLFGEIGMGASATAAAGLSLAASSWEENNPPHTAVVAGHSYDVQTIDNTLGYLVTDLV